MNLVMSLTQRRPDGIFGKLGDESGNVFAVTLEHAYSVTSLSPETAFAPKIPSGTFRCVRGKHRLHGMTEDFETFEITGVEGHSNLLFHWGNWNRDSEGCVLLGDKIAQDYGAEMITNSRVAFARFMAMQDGVDSFNLTVTR